MEDFQQAFMERHKDCETLDDAKRWVAAMHMGGITIECLLKAIIQQTLPEDTYGKKEWKTATNDPGHTISNPGHNYSAALRAYNKLYTLVLRQPHVKRWLDEVEHPICNFIDMRYHTQEPAAEKYRQWKRSYTSLMGWLQAQARKL